MRYLSVCSGIEAATCAWHRLGWNPVGFSEIEKFPSAVLAHHYPSVQNFGDMSKFQEWPDDLAPNLLVGGTPCQSFSVAGLRKGLDDPRGNLMLTFGSIARRYRPEWLVWENVPGVLSSNGGRDFGTFLGMLAELGYGFAYRVLDAQYFGCAVPRPRVFVVGNLRAGWQSAAAVLLNSEALANGKPRGRSGPRPHTLSTQNTGSRNGRGNLIAEIDGLRGMTPIETERALGFQDNYTQIPLPESHIGSKATVESGDSLRDDSCAVRRDARETGRGVCAVRRDNGAASRGSLPRIGGGSRNPLPPVQRKAAGDRGHGLGDAGVGLLGGRRVADGPRYKALGNSMAVPVMRWIGDRINQVSAIKAKREAA